MAIEDDAVKAAERNIDVLLPMHGPDETPMILRGYVRGFAQGLARLTNSRSAAEHCYRIADALAVEHFIQEK